MSKILIAEDEVFLRTLITQVLTKDGHQVFGAQDGQEAIDLYDRLVPDLLITDLIMPGKEGIETIIELHQRDSQLRIIAMSGGCRGNSNANLNMALKLGADCVLPKPFTVDELKSTVTTLLASRRSVLFGGNPL
ncbi:MAG: response regulator [Opitutaceae bacterium]